MAPQCGRLCAGRPPLARLWPSPRRAHLVKDGERGGAQSDGLRPGAERVAVEVDEDVDAVGVDGEGKLPQGAGAGGQKTGEVARHARRSIGSDLRRRLGSGSGAGAVLGDAVRGVLLQMATPAYNFVLPNGVDPTRPIVVNVPSAASIPQASRVARTLPAGALTWTCGLQGAINTVTVQGQLVP